jgi:endo-1,4-beta-xylanase
VAVAVAAVAVAAIVVAVAVRHRQGPEAQPLPGGPLRTLASARDIAIGTAVDATALRREPGYRADLAGQFSSVTPENAMKWAALEPSRGKYDWGDADRLVDFARGHDQQVRGHTLVWWNQLPGWLTGAHLGARDLRQALREHIRTVMGRYRGRVGTWDVVNEPLADDGSLRRSLWQRTLGDAWIADAFHTARTADPHAKLYLNEIGAEAVNAKSDALYRLVRGLRARGVPVDGVGFQTHVNLQGVPRTFRENLRRFAALGVDVSITEADVALEEPAGEDALRAQARVYRGIVEDCLAVRACRSLTFWGFTDRHSWIPMASPGFGSATLLDRELRPKPAYRAVAEALRAR